MIKAYELVDHIIETGEVLSTCSFAGVNMHIVRQEITEKGTELRYEGKNKNLTILIPKELDHKLIELRRLRKEICEKIELKGGLD